MCARWDNGHEDNSRENGTFLKVRPETLGRIAEFSEHEAD